MLISLLQRALHHYLALDPETLIRLSQLTGKVIKIELTESNRVLYLFPNEKGIEIKDHHLGNIDAEIKGSLFTLFRMRFADSKTTTALAKQLEMKGDIHLAQTFSQILQKIEIDWEEPLSKFTGDIIAHQIGSVARSFKRWGSRTKKNLQTNVIEYLQEEVRYLPPREEVEDFYAEIAKLQNDVARLEIKIRR